MGRMIIEGDGKTLPEHFYRAVLATFKKIAPVIGQGFDQHP